MKAENATEIETDAVHTTLGAIFLSLELSRSTWLVTSLLPCNGAKMSKRIVVRPCPPAEGDSSAQNGP